MNILLTGCTGNLGPELARQLQPHRVFGLARDVAGAPEIDGVTVVEGTLEKLPIALKSRLDVIVHGAASTLFRADLESLRRANVDGTARLLEYARECPHLRRFVHLSTTCVCGDTGGLIAEAPLPAPAHFINAYELSKWEAEGLVLSSGLPVEIARLSIVAGSEHDGSVRRPGALHQTLYWIFKGIVPMLPGSLTAPVDFVSTEFAAAGVATLLRQPLVQGRIVHVAAGERAPALGDLLTFMTKCFARHERAWKTGTFCMPDLVDAKTFSMFEATVRASRDALFRRVCEDAQSFLPGLLYPRTYATSLASTLPLRDWRTLSVTLIDWLIEHQWGRKPTAGHHHVAA